MAPYKKLTHKRHYILPLLSVVFSLLFYLGIQDLPKDEPRVLLTPISAIISSFLTLDITPIEGVGFAGISRGGAKFIIDKSCSGAVFLVICFSLLCITQLVRFEKPRDRIISFFAFFGCSYLLALLASALRVIPSILVLDVDANLNSVLIHNSFGIITFVTVIAVSFLLIERCVSKIIQKGCDVCEKQ